uniref:Uncharacterized protein n=1 Tax=Meloidogyne javanica TaxID=6303 RepID=A0A915MFS1_MELJA
MKEFERRRSVNGIGKVGSASSLSAGRETETILNPEWLSDDFCSSEELDKLSMCLSEFVVLPTAMVVCCTLSSMLTVIVILGRFFSSPVRFQDILHVDGGNDDNDGSVSTTGGGNGGGGIRRRTTSVSSCHSCGGSSIKGFTFSCDELPKPMCRKHSAEGSSLSLFGSNGNGSGIVRSDSIGGYSARPRLTHQYSHSPADGSGTSAVVDR